MAWQDCFRIFYYNIIIKGILLLIILVLYSIQYCVYNFSTLENYFFYSVKQDPDGELTKYMSDLQLDKEPGPIRLKIVDSELRL